MAPQPRIQRVRYGRVTVASALRKEAAARLHREAKDRGVSVSALIAELVDKHFPTDPLPVAKAPAQLTPFEEMTPNV